MRKLSIRIFSMLLSIIMMIGSVSCAIFAYAIPNQTGANLPYYDADTGMYYREHTDASGVKHTLEFHTNFDDVVDCFRQNLLDRKSSFKIKFATNNPEYAFSNVEQAADNAIRMINNAMYKAFTTETDNPFAGDFLYHSINMSNGGFAPAFNHYSPDYDKLADGQQYYTYELGLDQVDYYADATSEKYVEEFVKEFNRKYINPNDNEYTKLKTIYDFVVRNINYDHDVYTKKISYDNPRFKRAHSGYGAISGTLVNAGNEFAQSLTAGTLNMSNHFDKYFSSVKSVEDENIERNYNNGLAVCEGFSKLFYVLCMSNGIKCHIVDGNYEDGVKDKDGKQKNDPHEWNYVYLSDLGKWFQIDTTYASQSSVKEIDFNSYEYFLVGSSYESMRKENHQQPYKIKKNSHGEVMLFDYYGNNDIEFQLYDWYGATYKASVYNYSYPSFNLTNAGYIEGEDVKNALLVSRVYEYNGEERAAYILYKREGVNMYVINLEIDEDGVRYDSYHTQGFPYRSLKDGKFTYTFMVPYVINTERVIASGNQDDFVKAGKHPYIIKGGTSSNYISIDVPIIPLDMSGSPNSATNKNYSEAVISNNAQYTGNKIVPSAKIKDGFDTLLVEKKDYDINYYSDANYTKKVSEIKNIGKYYISIDYKGNYTGKYRLQFNIGKASINNIGFEKANFSYLPKKMRPDSGISTISQYFKKGYSSVNLGDYIIKPDTDYSVGYTVTSGDASGLSYGATGKIVLTAKSDSKCLISGSKKTITYKINEQFDIGNSKNGFDGIPASSKAYTYTGKAIKPTSFDNLKKVLDTDEYQIASYSNCTNAGKAKVTVKGIGGCTGTATMYYIINKKPISTDMVTITPIDDEIYIQLKYNGVILTPGTDYTVTKTSDLLTINAVANGNYIGSYKVASAGIGKLKVKYGNVPKTVGLSKSVFTYNGKNQKPSLVIKDAKGKTVSSKYYTATFPKSSSVVGAYTVTIKFKGSYSGTIKRVYYIAPKGTSLTGVKAGKQSFTANWKKQTSQTSGYEIRYGTNTKMSDAKIATVSKNTVTSGTVKKLKSKKTYYVQVRTYKTVNSKRITSDWSKAMAVTTK